MPSLPYDVRDVPKSEGYYQPRNSYVEDVDGTVVLLQICVAVLIMSTTLLDSSGLASRVGNESSPFQTISNRV